jgi:hypothetical protein
LSYHDSPTEDKIARSLAEPAIAQDNKVYFLGEGGWLDVRVDGRSSYAPGGNAQSPQPVLSVAWVDSPRTESDIRWQKYIGWTLAIVGIFATLFFARVLATRAFLSDQGLQLTGKPLVRWDQMRDLRPDPRKRGVVELEYESNGSRRTLRMDDYLYRDLARITAAIAAKKALNDPLAALQKA